MKLFFIGLFFQAATCFASSVISNADRVAKSLSSKDWEERFYAVRELRESKVIDGKQFVGDLKRILKQDDNYQVRDEAIWALCRIEGKSVLPTMVESLKDQNEVVRRSAVMGIGEMGKDASSAVEELIKRFKDSSRN